eukprot:Gb_36955 [translate_table: standard]
MAGSCLSLVFDPRCFASLIDQGHIFPSRILFLDCTTLQYPFKFAEFIPFLKVFPPGCLFLPWTRARMGPAFLYLLPGHTFLPESLLLPELTRKRYIGQDMGVEALYIQEQVCCRTFTEWRAVGSIFNFQLFKQLDECVVEDSLKLSWQNQLQSILDYSASIVAFKVKQLKSQRKELCKQREELEQRKKILQETIANRKKFLSSLPSHLKALKKSSLPVQQQLGILHTKRMKQHQLAELLPAPLYILYSQLLAQKEAFEEHIDLEIVGSTKDAQAFARQQAHKDAAASTGIEESKIDDDMPEEEDDLQRRRKRPKKLQGKENMDATGIYQHHPLSVILHIYDDETTSGAKPNKLVTLRFEYLLKLNVVCVGIDGLQEGNQNNFLLNLFPDDTGIELPHQSSQSVQTAKLSTSVNFEYDEKRALRPFKWAQHLAGIDFLPEVPPLLADSRLASNDAPRGISTLPGLTTYREQHRVQTILQRIRDRKKSQLALKEQLDSLAKLKWPPLKFRNVPWAMHIPKCTLHSWSVVENTGSQISDLCGIEPGTDTSLLLADGEGSSLKAELESTREDGELPSGTQTSVVTEMSTYGVPPRKESIFSNSSRLTLISKSVVPSKGKYDQRRGFVYSSSDIGAGLGEDLGENLLWGLDTDIDDVESAQTEVEADSAVDVVGCKKVGKAWEEFAVREFYLIYRRENGPHKKPVDLEAKVRVSMEYPLRPPLFALHLLSDEIRPPLPEATEGVLDISDAVSLETSGADWYNELRAMEAEVFNVLHLVIILRTRLYLLFFYTANVQGSQYSKLINHLLHFQQVNLHILKTLPQDEEKQILAHQVMFLSMLFDVHMDHELSCSEVQKGTTLIDVGLSEPISGSIISRSIRGRDRRKMISWNEKQKAAGYQC